jgi:homoserine acetyltransferase
VEAQYRLVAEGLGIKHLRLVIGNSMGGMHSWIWAEKYPDFMATRSCRWRHSRPQWRRATGCCGE